MKIQGEHRFNASRAEVWRAIQDPQVLANSLPGVKRLEERGQDKYALTVSVGVGSVKGTYDGEFELTEKHEAESCVVRASGRGSAGSVQTVAHMRLRDQDGDQAAMSYEADAKVTGALAGVGQRMIAAAARKTTEQFLAALDDQLTGRSAAEPSEPPRAGEAPRPEPEPAAAVAAQPGTEPAPPRGRTFTPPARPGPERPPEWQLVAGSALAGFVLALIGVAFGRWTARTSRRGGSR
jgi:carbon monoxide dehydrogenase subunit G